MKAVIVLWIYKFTEKREGKKRETKRKKIGDVMKVMTGDEIMKGRRCIYDSEGSDRVSTD